MNCYVYISGLLRFPLLHGEQKSNTKSVYVLQVRPSPPLLLPLYHLFTEFYYLPTLYLDVTSFVHTK